MHVQQGVELAEVVDGDDAEGEVVAGDDVEAALVGDRVEQPVCIALRRLPDAVLLPRSIDIGRWRPARLARPIEMNV
jgi:hypothetical protein